MNAESRKMKTVKNQKSEHVKVSLTISPETHAIIECIDSLNKHWEQVSAALQKTYSEEAVLEMMDKYYENLFFELNDALQRFLVQSIECNMGKIDFKQI